MCILKPLRDEQVFYDKFFVTQHFSMFVQDNLSMIVAKWCVDEKLSMRKLVTENLLVRNWLTQPN